MKKCYCSKCNYVGDKKEFQNDWVTNESQCPKCDQWFNTYELNVNEVHMLQVGEFKPLKFSNYA
jgi:hypothetical protein